jgi:hypothetical protein
MSSGQELWKLFVAFINRLQQEYLASAPHTREHPEESKRRETLFVTLMAAEPQELLAADKTYSQVQRFWEPREAPGLEIRCRRGWFYPNQDMKPLKGFIYRTDAWEGAAMVMWLCGCDAYARNEKELEGYQANTEAYGAFIADDDSGFRGSGNCESCQDC